MPVPRLNKTPEVENTIQSCAMGPRSAPRATTIPASLPPAEIFVAFLTGLDLSKHLALFTERGFHDIAILRTMARLDEKTLHTTLRRWLAEDLEHPGVTDGLTDAELLTFETAIRQL